VIVSAVFGVVGGVADLIVGGAGYMRGVSVERFDRDARLFRIYEGTSQTVSS
jgi:acyl-CoA dehydrogenase